MVIIGNYLVGAVVGKGRYGWVSRAKHIKLGMEVAMKHAPWAVGQQCDGGENHSECEHAKESSWKAALHQEASVLSRISHPSVVSLLEIIRDPQGSLYICLEDLGNTSLTNYVEAQSAINENKAQKIVKDLSKGLEYLHSAGILHRDIKPDNIMVIDQNQNISAKLIDLGLATNWNPDRLLNTSDIRVGTLAYMAPELMSENTMYGSPIDVFSLGASLFFALIGESPFQEFQRNGIKSTTSIFGLQMYHEDCLDKLSKNVRNLIKMMIHKEPEKRCSLQYLLEYSWVTPFIK